MVADLVSLAIDPLDPEQHPSGNLLNIITGEISEEAVNNFKGILGKNCQRF